MKIPKYIEIQLLSDYNNTKENTWNDYHKVRKSVSDWLTKRLGLTTDCNETNIKGFVVRYNWTNDNWYVGI